MQSSVRGAGSAALIAGYLCRRFLGSAVQAS